MLYLRTMTKFNTYEIELRNLAKSEALGATDRQGFTMGCFGTGMRNLARSEASGGSFGTDMSSYFTTPIQLVYVTRKRTWSVTGDLLQDWTSDPLVHDYDPFAGLSYPTGWLHHAAQGHCSAHYELADLVKYTLGEPGTMYGPDESTNARSKFLAK